MIGGVVRILMIAASIVTGWFVAKDAPLFGVVQTMVTIILLTLIVAVFAFWPSRKIVNHRPGKSENRE